MLNHKGTITFRVFLYAKPLLDEIFSTLILSSSIDSLLFSKIFIGNHG